MPLPALAGLLARLPQLGRAISRVSLSAEAATRPITTLGGSIGQFSWGVQAVTGTLGKLTHGMIPLATAVDMATGGIKLFMGAVTSVGNSVAEFVQLASPVEVQKFVLAVNDLTASFGKILIPVLEYGTTLVRMFADVLFSLSDPLQLMMREIFKPLTSILPSLGNMLASILQPIVTMLLPVVRLAGSLTEVALAFIKLNELPLEVSFRLLGSVLEAMAPSLILVAELLSKFASGLMVFADRGAAGLRRLMGLPSVTGGSVGAAVRPATISSVEEYGRKAQQAAFSLGTAANPAVETNNILGRIATYLYDWPRMVAEWILTLPKKLGDAIVDALPWPFNRNKSPNSDSNSNSNSNNNSNNNSSGGSSGPSTTGLITGGLFGPIGQIGVNSGRWLEEQKRRALSIFD